MGVLGGYLYWKVVLEFWFGHPKCHFRCPQKRPKWMFLAILGVPKMALGVPEFNFTLKNMWGSSSNFKLTFRLKSHWALLSMPDTQHQHLPAWHLTSASPPQKFLRFPNKAMWIRCVLMPNINITQFMSVYSLTFDYSLTKQKQNEMKSRNKNLLLSVKI